MILYWIYKNCDIKLISWKLFFLYEKLWKIMVTRNGFAGHSTASADWWLTHLLEFFFSIKYFSFKFHMSEKIRNIFSMFPAFPMSYKHLTTVMTTCSTSRCQNRRKMETLMPKLINLWLKMSSTWVQLIKTFGFFHWGKNCRTILGAPLK